MNLRPEGRVSAFSLACIAVSIPLLVYFVVVIVGLVTYPDISVLYACLQSPEIIFAVELSLITSIVSTALCCIVAIPVAYTMARLKLPGKKTANIILNIPLSLPPLVAGVALLIFYGPSVIGKMLSSVGISVVFTQSAIIIALFFVNVPYMIRVVRSAFESINPRYEHVAKTLGCSDWGAFYDVTLPLAKNGIVAGLVITWSKSIGEFGAVLMLAGISQMKTETLPLALYMNMSTGDVDTAIAAATILIVISIVSFAIFEKMGQTTEYI